MNYLPCMLEFRLVEAVAKMFFFLSLLLDSLPAISSSSHEDTENERSAEKETNKSYIDTLREKYNILPHNSTIKNRF